MPTPIRPSDFPNRTLASSLSAGFAVLLILASLGMRPMQGNAQSRAPEAPVGSGWVSVSDTVVKQLQDAGKKIGYPGVTAGVGVDRVTGDVHMIVPDQGLWRSRRHTTFTRIDHENISGRCETGYGINLDPAGKRMALFMLDGQSGMTLDNGQTWTTFQQHGRGWDFGVVDWSRPSPQDILAIHHESGQELHRSADGGKSWQMLGKDFTAIGIFDAKAYVASKGNGILRSADGGVTWTKVSDITPTGRVLCLFKGVGYWLTPEGLLISKDRGQTWEKQGSPLEAAWGPFFGKDEKQIAVVGRMGREAGLWQTEDAGKTWKFTAPFPEFGPNTRPDWTPSKQWAAGWFTNFGWDWKAHVFYASRMGNPTFAFHVK
jgi:photosystem II stability/assembly factor-like uncharacterized protein